MHDDFMDNGFRKARTRWMMSVVIGLFAILFIGVFRLQITDSERYRIQSRNNTMQVVPIEAGRGLIRDRNGVVLVDNRPSYTVSVLPQRLRGNTDPAVRGRVVDRLSQVAGLPVQHINTRLADRNRRYHEPVRILRDAGFNIVSVVEEERHDLPGVEIQFESRRGYLSYNGGLPLAPHIIGYVGLMDAKTYERKREMGYRLDDQIGKRGIERLYEPELRGREGMKFIEVDAFGREVGSFPDRTTLPVRGNDIRLTLDWRLQQAAELAFADSLRGSLVAMDPNNGEVLAMVSKPGFHPRSIRNVRQWRTLQADTSNPLLNRSIRGEYPPASVFKMIAAIAGLEMGLIDSETAHYRACSGSMKFGDRVFRCHNARGCGRLSLRGALVRSCDVYFYQLGRKVGIANWSRYARMLGFGQPTGIDVAAGGDGEAAGLVTDRSYYKERYGHWAEGYMLNLTIGQGETSVTPVQIARYVSALAVGKLPRPHVLRATTPESAPVQISAQTLKTIRSIMLDVVEDPYGTGKRARVEGVRVAGKTGTAQNSHGEDHAWFTALAPAHYPEIVVAVVVENAGHGGAVAAPIAGRVLDAYFDLAQPKRKADIIVASQGDAEPPAEAKDAESAQSGNTAPAVVLR
ncbi:MAG: penicillin-binding protein 2 [Gemmatimonadota bacterium]|nr:penicillin-binding protein 2 [Gemmatimonadota bacterium]